MHKKEVVPRHLAAAVHVPDKDAVVGRVMEHQHGDVQPIENIYPQRCRGYMVCIYIVL
jgi:hypothetical protein